MSESVEPVVKRHTRYAAKRERARLRQVPAEAMRVALRLAGGDPSRLVVDESGSVTILNRPRSQYR